MSELRMDNPREEIINFYEAAKGGATIWNDNLRYWCISFKRAYASQEAKQ